MSGMIVCKKTQNQTRRGSLLRFVKTLWILFLDLGQEPACFYKKIAFLKYHRFHLLSKLYYYKKQKITFFPRFKASITHLLIFFWKASSHSLCLEKNSLFFFFYLPCYRIKRAQSVNT